MLQYNFQQEKITVVELTPHGILVGRNLILTFFLSEPGFEPRTPRPIYRYRLQAKQLQIEKNEFELTPHRIGQDFISVLSLFCQGHDSNTEPPEPFSA